MAPPAGSQAGSRAVQTAHNLAVPPTQRAPPGAPTPGARPNLTLPAAGWVAFCVWSPPSSGSTIDAKGSLALVAPPPPPPPFA